VGVPDLFNDLPELANRHWSALGSALALDLHLKDRPLSLRYVIVLGAVHLLGLLAIVRLSHQPLWLALIPVLLIQPLAISLRLKKAYPLPESLAPFFFAYAVLILRLLIAVVARILGLTSGSLVVPQPWGGVLNLNVITGLCAVWALMAQAGPTTEAFGRRAQRVCVLGLALVVLTLVWAAVAYLTVRTHGVTGSDPYAYAQMAVDIARHGTALHMFPLAPRVAEWGLPVWPVVPVGYTPPDPGTGVAATVWPPGYSALLAVGYEMGGEAALYILTPLLGLAALVALYWLCLEVLHTWRNNWRLLATGFAIFVLATSYEQVDRLSVPMADIPAQLFTILTVYFALRATRSQASEVSQTLEGFRSKIPGSPVLFAALTGVCLGVAFAMRYTQVLLGLSILFLWALFFYQQQTRSRRTIVLSVASFVVAAWVIAFPVLWYHKLAFGGPLRVGGTAELALFAWKHVPRTLIATVRSLLIPKEFLYLAPFTVWGAIQVWRRARIAAIALLAWLVVIVSFHLPYPALRMRDLLSVLPVLAIWTGVGVADVLSRVRHIGRPVWRKGVQILVLGLIIAALWGRSQVVLWLPVHAKDFYTFGYLRAEQRAAFDTLAELTSKEGGVVAASLNGGAVTLYANRDIARPAYWSEDEWLDFVARALGTGHEIYLLVDGVEMQEPLEAVRSHYQLRQVSSLPMSYFYPGGNSENRNVLLYEVVETTTN
jgi:hypothetical protein